MKILTPLLRNVVSLLVRHNFDRRCLACMATLLADKWDCHYSKTLCWLRCRLSFSLLRSSIQALRGARSSRGYVVRTPHTAVDLKSPWSPTLLSLSNSLSTFLLLHLQKIITLFCCIHHLVKCCVL